MQSIGLDNPAWFTMFPHQVAPLQDEWLPGLLLRCDEANNWTSKTTLLYLLYPGPEQFHRCWHTDPPNLAVIQQNSLNIVSMSKILNISSKAIYATTYHYELARCYGLYQASPEHLNSSLIFRLCPGCVGKQRALHRFLILPHITHCPLHQTMLQWQCRCGTPLRLFHRRVPPFTCYKCGLDWSELPRREIATERLNVERKMISWYTFFFAEDTSPTLTLTRARVDVFMTVRRMQAKENFILPRWEPPPLGALVASLVDWNLSPQDFGV